MTTETFKTTDNLQVVSTKILHNWDLQLRGDEPGVFSLAGSATANVNANVEIFWHYPEKPLTLVIETPYTKKKTRFDVHFTDQCLVGWTKVYQIVDGKEAEKDISVDPLVVSSDSNYQVVVKLMEPEGSLFGSRIVYHAEAGGCDDDE